MPLHILPVDYQNPAHRQALVMLLDAYAQDPMGGGEALAQDVKARLCDDLAARIDAASFIAWLNDAPVGLVNCIEGYSTFKARVLPVSTSSVSLQQPRSLACCSAAASRA